MLTEQESNDFKIKALSVEADFLQAKNRLIALNKEFEATPKTRRFLGKIGFQNGTLARLTTIINTTGLEFAVSIGGIIADKTLEPDLYFTKDVPVYAGDNFFLFRFSFWEGVFSAGPIPASGSTDFGTTTPDVLVDFEF